MADWADALQPILRQFVAAMQGQVDPDFWNSIYSLGGESGNIEFVTGWIIAFFPHTARSRNAGRDGLEGINLDDFPSGVCKADFTWIYVPAGARQDFKMELVAGFVGIHQDEATMALRPEIGWAVREARFNKDHRSFLPQIITVTLTPLLLALAFGFFRRRPIYRETDAGARRRGNGEISRGSFGIIRHNHWHHPRFRDDSLCTLCSRPRK